jgi:fucose permease
MISTLDTPTRRLYFIFLAGFVIFGTTFTITGAALPRIIRSFGWSYAVTGAVLAASAVGYLVSTFASGLLVRRFQPKRVLLAGLLLGSASMLFFMRWPSPWLNLGLNLAIGVCQGTLELVTNLEVIHMERRGQSRLMNLMHAAFSVGAIAGPFAVGTLFAAGLGGTVVFTAAGALLSLMALLFALTPFPRVHDEASHGKSRATLGQPLVLLLTVVLLVYVGTEVGVSNWVSEYFVNVLGAAASMGAFSVSLFWAGLLAGRLGVSFLYKGTRQELLLLALALSSACALTVALLMRSPAGVAAAIFLVGLGFSAFYPVTMALVGDRFKSGVAVGTVATGGATGSFAIPFVMAMVAQALGLRGGFWFYLGLDVVLVVLTLALIRLARGRHE